MKVKDKDFRLLINKSAISSKVSEIAARINRDYHGKNLIFISVLNGSFIFTADLVRQISVISEVSFVKLASYYGTQSSGKVHELIGLEKNIEGKHVLIIEDIVDSGSTLQAILKQVRQNRPASINIVSLLCKQQAVEKSSVPKYVGFNISDKFVIGYGLDYDGHGRNLNEIYQEV